MFINVHGFAITAINLVYIVQQLMLLSFNVYIKTHLLLLRAARAHEGFR